MAVNICWMCPTLHVINDGISKINNLSRKSGEWKTNRSIKLNEQKKNHIIRWQRWRCNGVLSLSLSSLSSFNINDQRRERDGRCGSQEKISVYPGAPHRYSFNNLRHPPVSIRCCKLITEVIECRNKNGKSKEKRKKKWARGKKSDICALISP